MSSKTIFFTFALGLGLLAFMAGLVGGILVSRDTDNVPLDTDNGIRIINILAGLFLFVLLFGIVLV